LSEGGGRPLGRDYDTARALYDSRRAFYDEAALRIEVSKGKTAEALATEIAEALAGRC
jgi:shikimate kinase